MVNRNIAILAIIVIVEALAFTFIPWIWKFYDTPISSDPADWGVFGDYIGGTLATFLAAGSFLGLMASVIHQNQAMRKEWQLRDDESYNRQAIVCLERAYNRIMPHKGNTPDRDRLAWIDCARFLLSAEDLSSKIESDGFKAMYESERAHWRAQFRDAFDPEGDKFFNSNLAAYFYEGPFGEALEPDSVYVIYKFIKWQEDEPDPFSRFNYDWDLSKINGWPDEGPKGYLQELKDRHGPKVSKL
jgi:hypothetical protein